MNQKKTRAIVEMGVLTALVIVLQVLAQTVKLGTFSITLSLTPIIVGAALHGWKAGGWLGLVFGCVTLFDAALFMAVSVPGTVATCLVKGMGCGLAAALVYQALKKNRWLSVVCASVICPVANTGIFFLGCALFFYDTICGLAGDQNAVTFMFTGLAGVNFLIELCVNLILASAVVRILDVVAPRQAKTA